MDTIWHSVNEIPELHERHIMRNGFKIIHWHESDELMMTEDGESYYTGQYIIECDEIGFVNDETYTMTNPIAWTYMPVLNQDEVKVFERMAREHDKL